MGKVALETTQWDLLTKEQAHRYLRVEDFSILKFFAVRCGLRATSTFLLQLFGNMFLVLAKNMKTREEGGQRPKGGAKAAPNRA